MDHLDTLKISLVYLMQELVIGTSIISQQLLFHKITKINVRRILMAIDNTGNMMRQKNQPITKWMPPQSRNYQLNAQELIISCNMSTILDPTSTRLVPPLTWLSAPGTKIKVLHSSVDVEAIITSKTASEIRDQTTRPVKIKTSILEISIERPFVNKSLKTLRMNGFTRDDINRLVDKGPWILAFDLSKCIPKLFSDLQVS